MKIGIDVSQLAHEKTGVSNYLRRLVAALIKNDSQNEYVLFYASLRKPFQESWFGPLSKNVSVKTVKIPPTVLTRLWNQLHIIPIETFIGNVDIFLTSDWAEPPTRKAKKMTIIYDMIVYKHPEETDVHIINTQKKKLQWVKKESAHIVAISEATKKDIVEIFGIDQNKISVIYPGL